MEPAQWELLDAADRICRDFPASVTSWWRTPKRNAAQRGSVANSQHLHGLAVDLVFDGPQPPKALLATYCSPSMQVVDSEPGHIHIEQDPTLLARRGMLLGAAVEANAARARADSIASAINRDSPSSESPTPSPTRSAPSGSSTARTAGARSLLDKLGPKGKRRG